MTLLSFNDQKETSEYSQIEHGRSERGGRKRDLAERTNFLPFFISIFSIFKYNNMPFSSIKQYGLGLAYNVYEYNVYKYEGMRGVVI